MPTITAPAATLSAADRALYTAAARSAFHDGRTAREDGNTAEARFWKTRCRHFLHLLRSTR